MKNTIMEQIKERREVLKDRHEHLVNIANQYEEECNYDEMEWYRTRAMEIMARISEIDILIDMMEKY